MLPTSGNHVEPCRNIRAWKLHNPSHLLFEEMWNRSRCCCNESKHARHGDLSIWVPTHVLFANYIGPCSARWVCLNPFWTKSSTIFWYLREIKSQPQTTYLLNLPNSRTSPLHSNNFQADISGLLDSVWLLKTKVFSRVETPALSDDLEHLLLLL